MSNFAMPNQPGQSYGIETYEPQLRNQTDNSYASYGQTGGSSYEASSSPYTFSQGGSSQSYGAQQGFDANAYTAGATSGGAQGGFDIDAYLKNQGASTQAYGATSQSYETTAAQQIGATTTTTTTTKQEWTTTSGPQGYDVNAYTSTGNDPYGASTFGTTTGTQGGFMLMLI